MMGFLQKHMQTHVLIVPAKAYSAGNVSAKYGATPEEQNTRSKVTVATPCASIHDKEEILQEISYEHSEIWWR